MDFDIRSLAAEAAERLMNHYARIGQSETLALLAAVSRNAPILAA